MEALRYGKHVFCEKPMAQSASDCEKIIEQELKHNRRLVQVGFMRRYDRGYAACVASDILNRSRETGQFMPIEMIDKPDLYI